MGGHPSNGPGQGKNPGMWQNNAGPGGGVHGGNVGRPVPPPHNQVIRMAPAVGTHERTLPGGNAVRIRPNGRMSDIHDARRGMDIHHDLHGGRTVIVERPDHSRAYFAKGRPSFVEHPYNFHGHEFARRTYVYEGHTYSHFYHGFLFRGIHLSIYAPSAYYAPAYYGWAYNPWYHPIRYRWGWMGNPWYGHFGYYFAPYPEYPSASYWLTDYVIAQNLQAAYAAQQQGGEMAMNVSNSGAGPMLTPDVKQQIADEVRTQLALENQEAQQNQQQQDVDPNSSGLGRILSDVGSGHPHVFVVGSALDVVDSNEQECSLSDGDALSLQNPPAPNGATADLVVLASKGGEECQQGDTVTVPFDNLQEMQNHLRETIDQGLQELQNNQGKGGMPPAPVASIEPAVYTAAAPPPDPNAGADLQQQAQQADQSETSVAAAVPQDSSQTAPATIAIGQSISDVEAILGQPTSRALIGSKTIYNYRDMKVTFMDGRVVNVE
jgi:hypothetical protein